MQQNWIAENQRYNQGHPPHHAEKESPTVCVRLLRLIDQLDRSNNVNKTEYLLAGSSDGDTSEVVKEYFAGILLCTTTFEAFWFVICTRTDPQWAASVATTRGEGAVTVCV